MKSLLRDNIAHKSQPIDESPGLSVDSGSPFKIGARVPLIPSSGTSEMRRYERHTICRILDPRHVMRTCFTILLSPHGPVYT